VRHACHEATARELQCHPSALKWNALATDTACEGVLPPPQRGSNGCAVAHPAGRSPRSVFPHSHTSILHDPAEPRRMDAIGFAASKVGWCSVAGRPLLACSVLGAHVGHPRDR